jgi:hypothetical protein
MSVKTDRVKAILDNMKGGEFTNERAFEIVQLFNNSDENTERTVDEEATLFLQAVTNHVKTVSRRHKLRQLSSANDTMEQSGADDAVSDL